jgi:hypothetical protein
MVIYRVNNVDEILACHCDFLDSCLKDCMLTIPPILRTVTKLLSICVEFCQFMQVSSLQEIRYSFFMGTLVISKKQ